MSELLVRCLDGKGGLDTGKVNVGMLCIRAVARVSVGAAIAVSVTGRIPPTLLIGSRPANSPVAEA